MRRVLRQATREQTRAHTRRLVLKAFYERGEICEQMVTRSLTVLAKTTEIAVSGMGSEIGIVATSAQVQNRKLGLFPPPSVVG
jgi:hypothetical protein